MILPKNGSVVVIDDKIEEAEPLINELSKLGVANTYYSGKGSMYPVSPLDCVRLVFLDMILDETHALDEDQIIEPLLNGLEKIISDSNGPYVIFLWSTKAGEHIERFKEKLYSRETLKCKPTFIVDLEKAACFEHEGEQLKARADAMQKIEIALSSELEKYNILPVLYNWENNTKNASTETVSAICDICFSEEDLWNFHMRRRFADIASAYVGSRLDDYAQSITEGAYYCLNKILIDFAGSLVKTTASNVRETTYHNSVLLKKGTPDEREEELFDSWGKDVDKHIVTKNAEGEYVHYKNEISVKTNKNRMELYRDEDLKQRFCNNVASINSLLNIRNYSTESTRPGNAFSMSDEKKEDLAQEMGISKEDLGKITGFELEVSPVCEYSQNKRKRIRMIPGIIVPILVSFNKAYKDEKTKYAYCSDPIRIKGETSYMVLDFRYFFSEEESYLKEKEIVFAIGDELLNVIIDKMVVQISRGGIVSIRE